jgi:hypothetical protein
VGGKKDVKGMMEPASARACQVATKARETGHTRSSVAASVRASNESIRFSKCPPADAAPA